MDGLAGLAFIFYSAFGTVVLNIITILLSFAFSRRYSTIVTFLLCLCMLLNAIWICYGLWIWYNAFTEYLGSDKTHDEPLFFMNFCKKMMVIIGGLLCTFLLCLYGYKQQKRLKAA